MKTKPVVLASLKAHWDQQPHLRLRPGVSERTLRSFEDRYKTPMPELVKEYFSLFDGFETPNDQDAEGFRFWPLAEVRPVSAYDGGRFGAWTDVFLFADYMVFSWAYGITLREPSAPMHVIGTLDGQPKLIAPSFEEFLALYVRNSSSLHVS
jgi:hypothetical protein